LSLSFASLARPRRSAPLPGARGRGRVPWPLSCLLLGGALLLSLPGGAAGPGDPPAAAQPQPARRAAAAAEGAEAVLRQALDRIETRYLDPAALDPAALLEGGLRALAKELGAPPPEHSPGGWRFWPGLGAPALALPLPEPGQGPLAQRLAPPLWAALQAGAALQPERRMSDLLARCLSGALARLDRWSWASAGQERQAQMDRYRGTLAGIGAAVGRRAGRLLVLEVFPGSGAAQAGVQAEDEILSVDGGSVAESSVSAVVARLRGEPGTQVRVGLRREGRDLERTIQRSVVQVPNVSSRLLPAGVGLIRLSYLARNVGPQVERALHGLQASGPLRGLLLDLRGNSGGSMLAAGEVADLFIPRGNLIQALGRGGRPVPELVPRVDASGRGAAAPPLWVLLDEKSASSAELLAAALSYSGRALLVGQRSFGKIRIQKLYQFPELDLMLRLSVARMWAADRQLPDGGLSPDLWLTEPSPSAAAQRGALSPEPPPAACGDGAHWALAVDGASEPRLQRLVALLAELGTPTLAAQMPALRARPGLLHCEAAASEAPPAAASESREGEAH